MDHGIVGEQLVTRILDHVLGIGQGVGEIGGLSVALVGAGQVDQGAEMLGGGLGNATVIGGRLLPGQAGADHIFEILQNLGIKRVTTVEGTLRGSGSGFVQDERSLAPVADDFEQVQGTEELGLGHMLSHDFLVHAVPGILILGDDRIGPADDGIHVLEGLIQGLPLIENGTVVAQVIRRVLVQLVGRVPIVVGGQVRSQLGQGVVIGRVVNRFQGIVSTRHQGLVSVLGGVEGFRGLAGKVLLIQETGTPGHGEDGEEKRLGKDISCFHNRLLIRIRH